ncbi:MAG: hypothetical protein ACLFQX_08645 [Candidatus Kapaibacterium sp.]
MKDKPFEKIDEFARQAAEYLASVQRGFDEYQRGYFAERPAEFFSLELCGEAGELANIEKKRWKGKQVDDERFADEAADVLIALMNYSNARGIDLGAAVSQKLRWIEQKRLRLAKGGENY